ncbi:MAG: FAD:protein FMN transferase [Verrucomicrobia subdivision 3 bacterium]|nr:FAD:protein FMN transferase [Limisphaerales bacterium]
MLLLPGCKNTPEPALVRRSQPLLGTFVVITAYGTNRAATHTAISAAFDEFRRIDSIMSLHRTDSELARLNAQAASVPVVVSSELFGVIRKAIEVAQRTDGFFDPTVAPLTKLWGFLWKEHRMPTESELANVLPYVNYKLVELGENSVRFRREGVSLDLNAIAKGYAVDYAIRKLREFSITNTMVRAGGDLRVTGAPPGQRAWPVQIEDPGGKGSRLTIELRDAAISTSGSYENYFVHGGTRYSHILNPKTGLPVPRVASCSVIAPTCMESDAWATACAVLGPDSAIARFGAEFPMLFASWTSVGALRFEKSASFPATKPPLD